MDYQNSYLELPGEANPLSRDLLIRNLALGTGRGAGTNDLQTATKQLQEWENQSRFYLELQSVFTDQELPYEVRYLAILQLLSAVTNRHAWGRGSVKGVNSQDKQRIRAKLLVASYREPNDQLSRQNALLTAKIVRSDFPREWPNVFDDLNGTISGGFDHQNPVHLLQMRRALELLQSIVKEMSKAGLKVGLLRERTPTLLPPIYQIFQSCSSRFANFPETGFSIDDTNALGLLVPTASTIRWLLVRGSQHPHRNEIASRTFQDASAFWLTRVQQQHPSGSGEAGSSKRQFEKVLLQISKMHLELAEDNPIAFVSLPGSAQIHNAYFELIQRFAQSYGSSFGDAANKEPDDSTSDDQPSFMEKLVLKGVLVLRAMLRAMSDPNAIRSRTDEEKQQKEQIVQVLRTDFFPETVVQTLLETIVSKYFVFTASDLRRWEDEPDEWEAQEGGDTEGYRYSVRLALEKLFLDLVNRFTAAIVPSVIRLAQMTMADANVGEVQKESVYTALGLAADKIFTYSQKQQPAYNFNDGLQSLVQDVQNRSPGFRLIRRRVAILIGKWVHIQIAKANRPLVYQIFLHLLDKDDDLNDVVVRVTAGRQLKEVVSDWEFDLDGFREYAPTTIIRVMSLIAEIDMPETKMALLETISTIVEQMGRHIAPFADHIVSILPSLWDESGEETLRKQVIVTLLVRLMSSMSVESQKYQDFALFIIKAVLGSDSSLNELERMALLPDALDLWRAVLDNTPNTSGELHPDLLSLLNSSLIPVLGVDSEARRGALEIASSYFLLIPAKFLSEQDYVVELLKSQAGDLRALKPEASAQVFEVVEQLLQAADHLASTQGVQTVTSAMLEASFLRELMLGLREAYEAHQTQGPKAIVSNIQGQVETDFFAILSRILYASPELFVSLFSNPATLGLETSPEQTLTWLLEEWFSHAQDILTDPARQKLLTMALTKLFTVAEPVILIRLQQLMDLWVSVIESLTEGNDDKSVDSLVYPPPSGPFEASEGQSAGEARRNELTSADPVHKVNLMELVKWAVGVVIEKCGGPQRFQEEWLINVDKEVVEQFGKLGIV